MASEFQRQTAYKTNISSILNNQYFREAGWQPNYVEINGTRVSRVNIIGVVVSKQGAENTKAILLDDGTARINLQFFDPLIDNVSVGDLVTVIGRPKEFGTEKYVVPEIIKKISNPKWVEVRKLEIYDENKIRNTSESKSSTPNAQQTKSSVEGKIMGETFHPLTYILDVIKENDSGSGVSFEKIYEKISDTKIKNDFENHLQTLVKNGDVFEIRPGRYKVI